MVDGAREALAGYLYQILAATGLSARARGGMDDLDELTCNLVVLARRSRILHEVHGQDASLQDVAGAANEETAIQFKFSRKASSTDIRPAELREILYAFDRSRKAAAAATPRVNLTGFIVVTNRALSGEMRRVYEQDRAKAFGTKSEWKWLFVSGKKAAEVKAAYSSIRAAAQAWHGIFQQLWIIPQIDQAHWLDGLRHYAVKRGLPPEDFEAACNHLVGQAVRTTIGQAPEISRAWLNQALLKYSDARSLDVAEQIDPARAAAQEGFVRWFEENLVTARRTLIRRSLLDLLAEEVVQHSIILLLGAGGCGKSILAAQYLVEAAPRRFVAAIAARDFHQHWVGELFNGWCSTGHHQEMACQTAQEALRRLCLANQGGERPILVIDSGGPHS